MLEVELKPGREKALLRGHPWVFSGSINAIRGEGEELSPGKTGRIVSSQGDFIAWGAFSPASKIRMRVWSRDPVERINQEFIHTRLENAIRLRRRILDSGRVNACRLVNAESDELPGIIVDKYAETLVIQCLSAGAEYWRDTLVDLLMEITGAERIHERSDADIRKLEDLPLRSG
ncbi:MAG: 23S rRNA (cytosine(1962)-C(5))-methyltransferase RlmI, partial [Chloroflexota bacterium]